MDFLLVLLLALAIPFVLPIAAWVSARRSRTRLEAVEAVLEEQREAIGRLTAQLAALRRQAAPAEAPGVTPAATVAPPPVAAPKPVAPVPAPAPAPAPVPAPPVAPPPVVKAPAPTPTPVASPPAVPAPAAVVTPAPAAARPPDATLRPPAATVPPRPRVPPPPPAPPPPPPPPGFDWESLVGVKLFSAIAGVALVFAAVFFLKYSVEHGWLQPPIRVLIGIAVGVALLVVCEMKAARRYPVTANALDAAAIAILFSTFFAAHALWELIPALPTFVLLGVVTAVAVLLSIRRESLFIAVLGLLGGFATPALLSSGENKPIGLFAYLMLLNVGLAWVAYRQTWPLLTGLTLVLTTIYQWVWVFRYLHESPLPLAMAIFIVFPLATFVGLMLARRSPPGANAAGGDVFFERTAVFGAVVPLAFAIYLSAVPAYGAHPWLLFGFLLLIDVGLFTIAVARDQGLLHVAGAGVTVAVMALWLGTSYASGGAWPALVFTALFVVFFTGAPVVAAMLGREVPETARDADYAAPLLLFVPAVLARIEPAFAEPLRLFGVLLALVLVVAWRAVALDRGALYFVAAFFAIATEATWSATHLTLDRLSTAVAIYTVFGVASLGLPIVARRVSHPFQPQGGGGLVLLASLALLLFLSNGPVAPAALWALALLLAILNAGLFIESAAGGLPLLSAAGSLASWVVLASWWLRAAAAVGILPSLVVLTGLSLITFAGHTWAHLQARPAAARGTAETTPFTQGLFLGLIGHLFLLLLVITPRWSVPPWPWLATLTVLTLAASAVSLATGAKALHAAGAIAAGLVIAFWAGSAPPAWSLTALIVAAGASAYAVGWFYLVGEGSAAVAAAAVLLLGESVALNATADQAPFPAVVAAHVVNLSVVLALTAIRRWRHLALGAVVVACVGSLVQADQGSLETGWLRLFVLTFAMYAVFVAYPFVLGRRAAGDRDPYLAAVLASGMMLVAGRSALVAGGFSWGVGALPVGLAAVLVVLLRGLLRLQAPAERDLGRLAVVAGAALALVTVAIPMQLERQWITIGWALEGAALAWLFRRIPHRGLLAASVGLLAAVFVRLALNPEVLIYEPRGGWRILNWYLYAYMICAAAFLLAAWWLSQTEDRLAEGLPRASALLPAGAVILLFLLLNIEIADFYATGPTIMFRFGATVSQDLTYTIGWLVFGIALLAVCIRAHNRPGRIAALALVTVTIAKCFTYDLWSLGGLYRVASLVGLAMSLALVTIALQKYVLVRPEKPS